MMRREKRKMVLQNPKENSRDEPVKSQLRFGQQVIFKRKEPYRKMGL